MAAAAVSLACPLRRSTRLAHAHSNPPNRQHHKLKSHHQRHPVRPTPDPEPDHDSSSDPENELTPRALRALKRQRLTLDPDGLPFSARPRPKKRRKEPISLSAKVSPPAPLRQLTPHSPKRLSSPSRSPLTLKHPQTTHGQAHPPFASFPTDSSHSLPSTAATNAPSILDPIKDPPSDSIDENWPSSSPCHQLHPTATLRSESSIPPKAKPELSIPLSSISAEPPTVTAAFSDSSESPEPLTPLTPLTPSPESSPSLPGHDRQVLPLSPPHDPLPPPTSLDSHPIPSSSDPTPSPPGILTPQQLPTNSFTPPPLSTPPISLDPALDTLIPFEGLHPQFESEISVQISSASCQPSTSPQLQGLELQEQFHSFPPPLLYVPRTPVFVRDREINIWKLACQERVDYLLRRYGIDYIKALVESEASVSQQTRLSPSSGTTTLSAPPSQTKFRLYTPASYTYSSTSWGSPSGSRKAYPVDDEAEDADTTWPMDDGDWLDADADADVDVDMEDEDEDDYEDDDDVGEGEAEGYATLEAVQGLVIADGPIHDASRADAQTAVAMHVDDASGKLDDMQVDDASQDGRVVTKATVSSEAPVLPRPANASLRPLTPIPQPYPSSPPATPPVLPPLSSLHVPLLSEPPRAFMGRGTPPDRRRLIEWSGSGRFATNGMGPPLYLSPVPQRHTSPDVGIVPMSVDAPMNPPPPHSPHTHGEWTSFLYSMLEGDGVGVGVGTNVSNPSHASEPTWYELGLGSVPTVVPENALDLPLSQPHPHTHGRTPAVEQPVEEGNNSSSTLRFALG